MYSEVNGSGDGCHGKVCCAHKLHTSREVSRGSVRVRVNSKTDGVRKHGQEPQLRFPWEGITEAGLLSLGLSILNNSTEL